MTGSALLGARLLTPHALRAANLEEAASPSLSRMIRHPLLVSSLYRHEVSKNYAPDGAAGANVERFQWIEEQRQGAEWIVRGLAEGRDEWAQRGWLQLDWGLSRQAADGGFDSKDPFHSTSLFLEALARGLMLEPAKATDARKQGLARAAACMLRSDVESKGVASNAPYTHRRYILAAGFGQAGAALNDAHLIGQGEHWAREGLAQQQPDGTNPEKGGFDASYQMVGVLMALRYLAVCKNALLRASLRSMTRAVVRRDLERQRPDGSIDAEGSTRVGLGAARSGKVKEVSYGEVLQALVFGAQALPESSWIEPAQRIVKLRSW